VLFRSLKTHKPSLISMNNEKQSEGKRDEERDGGHDKSPSPMAPPPPPPPPFASDGMKQRFSSFRQPDDGISQQSTKEPKRNIAALPKAWKTDDDEAHHEANYTFLPSSSNTQNRVVEGGDSSFLAEKLKHANRSVTFRSKGLAQNFAEADLDDERPRVVELGAKKSGYEMEERSSVKSSKTRTMTLPVIEAKPGAKPCASRNEGSQPGAFHQNPFKTRDDILPVTEGSGSLEMESTPTTPPAGGDDFFLLEAQIVEQSDLVEAYAVKEETTATLEMASATTGRKRWKMYIFLVVVIVAVVASVVVTKRKKRGEPITTEVLVTTAPSPSPTLSPTQKPWLQVGQSVEGAAPYDWFGYSVSLSSNGTIMAAGALTKLRDANLLPQNKSETGYVQSFQFNSGQWKELGTKILGSTAGGGFGSAVALSCDGLTLAAAGDADTEAGVIPDNIDTGYVRVFRFVGSDWQQVGQDLKGTTANDLFGKSLALSGDGSIVACGAPHTIDANGYFTGMVQIFQFNGTQWQSLGSPIDKFSDGEEFGFSVALSQDGFTVAVGSRYFAGTTVKIGRVRVFRLIGTSWGQVGQDLDGIASSDQFGWSVALSSSGNIVAGGAPDNDDSGDGAGHVRVFNLTGNTWVNIGKPIVGKAAGDRFGIFLDLSSDGLTMASGGDWNDGDGTKPKAGVLQVWRFTGTDWQQVGQNLDGVGEADQFGYSGALSGDGKTVAGGGFFNDNNNSDNAGHVRVFTRED